jgi:hypothetical protein
MISLGCVDAGVSDAQCSAYLKEVEALTRRPLKDIQAGSDRLQVQRLSAPAVGTMGVKEVQQALKDLGFFPGGQVDGICGYRTQSAIRLFQEYVRTVEKRDCRPDGQFGPASQAHLQRWLRDGLRPNWEPAVAAWRAGTLSGEFAAWLAWLNAVKAKYQAAPSPVLQLVNAFAKPSDTRKVKDWDFSPQAGTHLIGIRREVMSGKFDDIFVLLIKGLVYKFQGTTDPGATENPAGMPFLVPGQHNYHFGWHKSTYLALRPEGAGVLVVRAGADAKLTPDDLARGLEANATINIHWGGRGLLGQVNNWSEGCQVITGSVYVDPANQLVSCQPFAAVTPAEPRDAASKKTRGAYNMLLDLVTALGSDVSDGRVKYTLVEAADLALLPDQLRQDLARVGKEVVALAGG